MNISENNKKYRNEWVENLEIVNKYFGENIYLGENINFDENIKSNEQFLIDLINDYVILTKLSLKEIDLDENETNKDLTKANIGLDCWDLFFNNLISYSSRFVNPNKLLELIKFTHMLKTNNVNETMFSNGYKQKKRLEESDTKLESYIL